MLIEELKHHASGLIAASDAIELPTLRVRLIMAAEVMLKAARELEFQDEDIEVPAFLRKQI